MSSKSDMCANQLGRGRSWDMLGLLPPRPDPPLLAELFQELWSHQSNVGVDAVPSEGLGFRTEHGNTVISEEQVVPSTALFVSNQKPCSRYRPYPPVLLSNTRSLPKLTPRVFEGIQFILLRAVHRFCLRSTPGLCRLFNCTSAEKWLIHGKLQLVSWLMTYFRCVGLGWLGPFFEN